MTLRFELFAAGRASPEALWALVGVPARLPEWTDAESVAGAPTGLEEGAEFVTVEAGGRRLAWRIITADQRLWEAATATPRGHVQLGLRVVRQTGGSRLVLAGALTPAGTRWRARLLDVPSLRGRMDRWAARAMELAATGP
jgi:hypothetical protein